MFDFAWSEIALIAAVALIAIGPKDMPAAIRGITDMIKKARRMAAEFQTHVDEMVRDANLDEVRSSINEIRNFDVRGHIEGAVDPDGSLRGTFASNPLEPTVSAPASPAAEGAAVIDLPVEPGSGPMPEAEQAAEVTVEAPVVPAFIPPNVSRSCAGGKVVEQEAIEPVPPAFIPPEVVLQRRSRPSG